MAKVNLNSHPHNRDGSSERVTAFFTLIVIGVSEEAFSLKKARMVAYTFFHLFDHKIYSFPP